MQAHSKESFMMAQGKDCLTREQGKESLIDVQGFNVILIANFGDPNHFDLS